MVDGPSIQLRRGLVHHLRHAGFLHDQRVVEAFLAVPREVFLAETLAREGLAAVYRDDAIVTRRDPESHAPLSSSSQPAIMAIMLEMLDVQPGDRVLEIGAGTGYNAALLALLAGCEGLVVTMDIDPEIALGAAQALRAIDSGAHTVAGDGALGLPGIESTGALMDRIEVTASSRVLPHAWHDQLAPDGLLVVPLRLSEEMERAHAVSCFARVPDGFDSVAVTPGGFMPLRRPDGSTFDPTSRAATAPPRGSDPSLDGGGGSPFAQVSRAEMDRLTISVRYQTFPPTTRWRFNRGDHWIGVDVGSP